MKPLLLRFLAIALLSAGLRAAAADEIFDFDVLRYRAKMLAAKPYAPRPSTVPESLRQLSYDDYRLLTFNPDETWWRREKLPFQLQFYHPGFVHTQSVQINEVSRRVAEPVKFSRSFFDYSKHPVAGTIPDTVGFAGFRVLGPLNYPADELVSFLGASYFRALCLKAVYGLSARGLAINTAEPGPEEFPTFEEFWIERPAPGAKQLVIHALLTGPSVAGAYRFTMAFGTDTVLQIKAAVFCRQNPKVFGIAPLTSMFWHGENSDDRQRDIRPEVHDSDGLMMFTGAGEWLWRPLSNPGQVRSAAFADENPRGFGLVQRDRKFSSYEDLEGKYHLRPSAWIEPVGNWGKGSVRLVEIPTDNETNDNIVMFWVPETLPAPGEPIEFEYKLHWFMEQIHPPAGFVAATRTGYSRTQEPELRRFVLDFDGTYLRNHKADPALEIVVTGSGGGTVLHPTLLKNDFNGTWRAAFAVKPDGSGRPVELRCFLRKSPHVLTETWSYLWNP
ncbi:MAG TPA: glucan biosynthesis protein G [Opitutaceae bacterium]|nr:glucan biosynthesis protein G [Opitutaceae bacterium]